MQALLDSPVGREPAAPSDPAPRSWPWRLFWLVACAAVCLAFGPALVAHLHPGPQEVLDFFQEWASARNPAHGLPVYERQEETMFLYLGYKVGPHEFVITRNAHPPSSVLLALPLSRLDYPDAFLVWSLLSLVALGVSLWIVVRQLRIPFTAWSVAPTVTLLLVCNPFSQQMIQGQLNLILLLLVTCVWAADRSERPAAAGLCLGAATAIKLFPGLLFVYFLLRRRWAVFAWGVAGLALLTALTAVVFGPAVYENYVRLAMPEVAVYYDKWPNLSIAGFWLKLFEGRSGRTIPIWRNPTLARTLIVLSWELVAIPLARTILRAKSRSECDRGFALTLTAMLLLSPITWDHYFVLLLLPAAILWRELPPTGLRRSALRVCLVLVWLTPMAYWYPLTGATIKSWMTRVAAPWQTLTALSLPCYALVGLFLLGLSLSGERTAPAVALATEKCAMSDSPQMLQLDPVADPAPVAPLMSRGLTAVLFVWAAWGLMLASGMQFVRAYGSNVPFWDDWNMVPVLTGHEPLTLAWLWVPNNEHRIPLPKLAYIALVRGSGFDWRSGMYASVLCLGVLSAGLIVVVRRSRGYTAFSDAIFPLALQHLGQRELVVVFSDWVRAGCVARWGHTDPARPGR